MTFLTIVVVLIIGVLMLVTGYITKKSWLRVLSMIPLMISGIQIVILMNL